MGIVEGLLWTAVVGIGSAALGGGLTVAATDFTVAKWCFSLSAVCFLAVALRILFFVPDNWPVTARLLISILVIGAIGAGWSESFRVLDRREAKAAQEKAAAAAQRLDIRKINIFLAHANTFNYRGATDGPKEEDRHRIIDPLQPVHLDRQSRQFAFGVDNANIGIPFNNVRLNFYYHGTIPLRITETHRNEANHKWYGYLPNKHYFYDFRSINARWSHSWGSLVIEFPKPGTYRFDFEATGEGVNESIKTYLEVVVTKM